MTSSDKVSIKYGDTSAEFNVIPSTEGPGGIDISKLMATTGLSSYDQGFVNTSSILGLALALGFFDVAIGIGLTFSFRC